MNRKIKAKFYNNKKYKWIFILPTVFIDYTGNKYYAESEDIAIILYFLKYEIEIEIKKAVK